MHYVVSLTDGFWYLKTTVTMNYLKNAHLRALISLSVTKATNLILISAYDYVI